MKWTAVTKLFSYIFMIFWNVLKYS